MKHNNRGQALVEYVLIIALIRINKSIKLKPIFS